MLTSIVVNRDLVPFLVTCSILLADYVLSYMEAMAQNVAGKIFKFFIKFFNFYNFRTLARNRNFVFCVPKTALVGGELAHVWTIPHRDFKLQIKPIIHATLEPKRAAKTALKGISKVFFDFFHY